MCQNKQYVLTINAGSSSIKFVFYRIGEPMQRILTGKIDRIGLSGTHLTFTDLTHDQQVSVEVEVPAHKTATSFLMDWLEQQNMMAHVCAVGHRLVHGMTHTQAESITLALLDELRAISDYDPGHLPGEIELIEAFIQRFTYLPQVACFDTAFHQSLPRVARLLPIPRRFDTLGIQRYGFHGLSYAYLMQALEQVAGRTASQGRVILAHLGNGASLAAVRDGRSIDTTMGFTPAGGLVMGTRSGDLDPGVAWYMMQKEQLTLQQFNQLINHQSGLLGMSGTSPDMRDLLLQESSDVRAAEAIDVFCYQLKKWIGSFAAALGGLDTLVFAGGIGEHASSIRARTCAGLEFLGIDIEKKLNTQNAAVISTDSSRVAVRIMHTDEELMIAKSVCRILELIN